MNWVELFGEIFKFFNNLFHLPSGQIKKIVSIYDTMHRILDDTDVQQVLIFKVHNGGGLIKPNSPIFVSVLYEDYTTPVRSVKDSYQRLEVDREYLKMLSELYEKRHIKIKTNKLIPKSLQHSLNVLEGIEYMEFFFLGQDRRNVYFCVCSSVWENGWSEKIDQDAFVKLSINSIKNNIR